MSEQAVDVTLKLSLPDGWLPPEELGAVLAEIQYDRVVPQKTSDSDREASVVVLETLRFDLNDGLAGVLVVPDVNKPSDLIFRLLRGNGIPAVSRSIRVESEAAISVSIREEELKRLLEPLPQPAAEARPVMRNAMLVPADARRVAFDQCVLQVAPVSLAGEAWTSMGLAAAFGSARPTSTAVDIPGTTSLSADWQAVHLAIDGRFSASFSQGAGDAWLWRLLGARNVLGVVLDDLKENRRETITLTLPPSPTPVGEPAPPSRAVPASVTERELADNPDVYSEDPGAFCRPFSNPERILGERAFGVIIRVEQPAISGVPSIKTAPPLVLDFDLPVINEMMTTRTARGVAAPTRDWRAALEASTSVLEIRLPPRYVEVVSTQPRGRTELDADHPIQWEGDPSRYQAATVARGHILEYRVRWRSNGYSLGNVASTLTLAPRQVKRIQKVEWRRAERARRAEQTTFGERSADELTRERSYEDQVQAGLSEWSRGESHASASSAAGGFGFAGTGFVVGGGGVTTNATTTASQEGGRRVSASEDQRLRDSIRRYADALRRFESTVVTEVTQEETVTGTVEVIRNPNFGHSLTVIYHQILRHLRVDTEVAGVRECLFVPFAMKPFTLDRAYRWREAIERHLRDQRYVNGLRHLKQVMNGFANSNIPAGRRSDLAVRFLYGSIFLNLGIERPKDGPEGVFDEIAWNRLNRFLGAPPRGVFARLKELVEQQRDRVFQEQYAPRIAAKWVDTLALEADGQPVAADFTLATQYHFNGQVRVDFTAVIPDGQFISRETLRTLRVKSTSSLPPGSTANVARVNFTYQTDFFEHTVATSQGVGDLISPDTGDADMGATTSALPSLWERQDLRAEMIEAVSELISHLNEHQEFYNKAALWETDRDRLLILLDGFYVPRTNGVSIASVVERDPIAIIGNCLVYRVSAGSFLGLDDIRDPQQLFDYYVENQPPRAPMLVSLPTDGLYAQTIMDECEALEQHHGNTDWVLSDREPELGDLPPELLQSRRADVSGTITPTNLPATIINLQNAPDAPAPTGLAGVLGAVSSANAFRDITGISGTQANARAAMEAAASLATNFGNQAAALKMADIAAKAQATQNVDQQLASIQKAKQMELISDEEAAKQASAVLTGMHTPSAGGGPDKNAQLNKMIGTAGKTAGSVVEMENQEGKVRVEMGKGDDVGEAEDAKPADVASEAPRKLGGLWFDDHGRELSEDDHFDVSGDNQLLALVETEHAELGESIQAMIDFWARKGLIHGGAMIDTKAHETGSGLSAAMQDWEIFLPNPAKPLDPYSAISPLSHAHWHYITPDPVYSDRASQTTWTNASLETALKTGQAAALSIGQMVMLAGDYLDNVNELIDPAAQPRWSGGGKAVHVLKAFEEKDPVAYTLLDLDTFPPEGIISDELAKLEKLERGIREAIEIQREIGRGEWKRVEALVTFMKAARGPTPFTELHLLGHSLNKPTITGRYHLAMIRARSPWLTDAQYNQLKTQVTAAELKALEFNGLPDRFFSIVASNGYYAALAYRNAAHFAPGNWKRFSDDHREALEVVRTHVTSGSAGFATAPLPAEAIARTAYSLHYLTDAFSSGHMRVPRVRMGVNGGMAAKVMHDVDNEYGLVVKNGFGNVWRAFGDGYLNPHEPLQMKLLEQLKAAGGPNVNAERRANFRQAITAIGAAFKQLHYEAQRHKDEANAAPFKPTLEQARYSEALAGDGFSYSVPGDGGFSDWLSQDIAAKITFMEKHRPRPVAVGPSPTENHPPLYEADGKVSKQGYVWFSNEVTKLGKNRVLRLSWHGNTMEFDYSDLYQFSLISQGLGGWWDGGETWLPELEKHLKEVRS